VFSFLKSLGNSIVTASWCFWYKFDIGGQKKKVYGLANVCLCGELYPIGTWYFQFGSLLYFLYVSKTTKNQIFYMFVEVFVHDKVWILK